jgi:tetratricopeptide (TPR) repeat protein
MDANKDKKSEIVLDEALNTSVSKAEQFFESYKKQIYMATIGILALAGLYAGYKQFIIKPQEEEAQVAIFMAQKYFEQDSIDLALNGKEGQFSGMLTIVDEYGSTKTGNLAKYYAGMCFLKKGEYQNAIDQLESFSANDDIIAPLAEGAIGDANVELANYDAALKHFIKAAQMSKNKFSAPLFYKKAGLVYEEMKEYSKAAEIYELIKKDYKESTEGQEMDKYIARAKTLAENS